MKLDYRRTFLAGLAFLTISSFWQLYDFVIPLILKDAFGIGDTVSGVVMSADNILALFLLPLFGSLSDKTICRMGRRMPYIVFGTACAVVFMMLIPFSANQRIFWLFCISLALVLLSMAVYRSPAVALMPDITPKPLRSKGNAVINLMGALGGTLVLALSKFLAPDDGSGDFFPLFGITAGIMAVGVLILFLTTDENKLVTQMRRDSIAAGIDEVDETEEAVAREARTHEKLPKEVRKSLILILCSISLWFMGYNAVTTAFSKYATTALSMPAGDAAAILLVAQIVAIVAFLPVGMLSSRLGRRRSILIGIVVLTVVFVTAAFYTSFSPLMYVSFALAGIAWAMINVNSLPMVVEMCRGADVGKFTGYYYTFSMSAQIITPILSGWLFELEREILGSDYRILFPYGAFFVALSFVTMFFVRHGDSEKNVKVNILEELEN